jgi:hypothetical protein
MGSIEVLNPAQNERKGELSLAGRIAELNGRVVAFLGNGKANARPLLNGVEEMLRGSFGRIDPVRVDKPHSGVPVNLEALGRCDAVVTAIGD